MAGQKWWFAPEEIDTPIPLTADGTKLYSTKINNASELTIRMVHAYIKDSRDKTKLKILDFIKKERKKTNDLFIATKYRTGDSPIISRVHVCDIKYEVDNFVQSTFRDVVCSFEDFTAHRIILQSQIYDIDGYSEKFNQFSDLAQQAKGFTATFPVVSQFIGVGITVGSLFFKILDEIDKHDKIIDESIKLYVEDPGKGDKVLQTGNIVCFSEEIPLDEKLMLNSNRKVVYEDGKEEFRECDYVVYTIKNHSIKQPELDLDQRAATLLTQLENGKSSGKTAQYLRDTMDAYSKIKKLTRLIELQNKPQRTIEEENQLKKLQKDDSIKNLAKK